MSHLDRSTCPDSWPQTYYQFFDYATQQVSPLLALVQPDRPGLSISGPASDHDAQADDLEAFVRPLLLVAQWLPLAEQCEESGMQARVAEAKEWVRHSIELGSDSELPSYWGGSRNFHQHQVEMGLFALVLCMNDGYIYRLLSTRVQDCLTSWMATGRGCTMHRNNHMFFGIFILEFLHWSGHSRVGDRRLIDSYFVRLESMHTARGWFIDGMNETVDYYNAFAFHYYGLWWSLLFSESNPERAERWKKWASEFLKSYAHLFSAEGDFPLFGRSMTYRFGVIAPFPLAELLEINPLSHGATRRLCRRNLEFFLEKPIEQKDGCWSIGFIDENISMAESYSCGGSPYWAAKGFACLSLPPTHPFWMDAEVSMPAERGDSVIALPAVGLVFRNFNRRSELLNTGVAISECNTRFGPFKWGKQSYRSGVGTLLPTPAEVPLDSGLVARALDVDGSSAYGRHVTVPIETSQRCVIYAYCLGEKTTPFHVEVKTFIFWNQGWLLQVHLGHVRQACSLSQGTYALPTGFDRDVVFGDGGRFACASAGSVKVSFQSLTGYEKVAVYSRGGAARSHSHSVEHGLLCGETCLPAAGTFMLASITGEGEEDAVSKPWGMMHSQTGELSLSHPMVGHWEIRHPDLPSFR